MSLGKKLTNIFTFLILVCAAAALIIYSKGTGDSAREGLLLCANAVIPSLFPFFVVSALAVELGAAQYVDFIFEPIMRRLFNVGGACSPAFVLGLIGGYPVGAKTAVLLYQKNLCSKTEAERLLSFCNNSGPAFILGVAGAGIFGNPKIGLILYPAHIAAAVTTGIIFGLFYKRSDKPAADIRRNGGRIETCKISSAFIISVRSALDSILSICSFVIIFSVIIKIFYIFNIIPTAAKILSFPLSAFGMSEADARLIIGGFFEITSGLWSISKSASTLIIKLAIAAFMLGWGGISVHCQVMAFTHTAGLSIKPYFCGKIMSAFFAVVYSVILFGFFNFEKAAFLPALKVAQTVKSVNFYKILVISSASGTVVLTAIVLLAVAFCKIKSRIIK